jgi:hypothetical protein
MLIKDRIKELLRVPAKHLLPNPKTGEHTQIIKPTPFVAFSPRLATPMLSWHVNRPMDFN